ncbi:glycerophosphoryl diester phosphodiesterase [Streptomyces sp. KhCrAH-43]|uniref:glycerophosphodiester phosphodiesterase n=1 Tax=unclassified Streptomyces TaxID=2593676 RepID=UPI00036ABEC5|nr:MULTISPECIES: glycerophosphodiester phosphodiesterase [unclassified Streptomyces]MYS37655.1 glycerophosphodiester phosphodiesterase [Streptomyces sp. SID4920]MYX65842.1 glycerophosphodiester phosphodiesterase [Streptomyces sp. SID8373]RAJ67322.1 glycerophosphoryl diester phosphodiesterase [Streptomyces sp. KhCrAH-43]
MPIAMPVTAVAHRGDPYRARENTLPSIRSALARGADAVEVDVRVTRDGVPVLLHDATLDRLWGRDLRLDRLSHQELTELTQGGVPTLREALLAVGAHRVMVDLPGSTTESVKRAVGVVRECGAGERVYYCAGPEAMLRVRAADPSAEIAMTWTTLAPPRPALLDAVRPRWLNYRFGLVSQELTDRNHRDGLLVSAWTADTGRTMRRLIGQGVDSVTTNRIDVLRKLIDRHGGR